MTQTHQAKVDLSQLDLSDWRKRIHALKQELRETAASPYPFLTNPPLTYSSRPSSRADKRQVKAT